MRCLALLLLTVLASASEPLATFHEHSVRVTVTLAEVDGARAVLVGRFEPDQDEPLHLYDLALTGEDGGVATRLDLAPDSAAAIAGPPTADQPTHTLLDLQVYPDGPVTIRQPILLPDGPKGGSATVTLHISYMACTAEICKRPMLRKPVDIVLPTYPRPVAPTATFDPEVVRGVVRDEVTALRRSISTDLDRRFAELRDGGDRIRFAHPTTVAETDTLIDAAHAEGRAVILDFTGPSCTVCQQMARTVLRVPEVVAAWNTALAIEIDTDRHGELAAWQFDRFRTYNRPLYVRLDPPVDGKVHEERWDEVFDPKETEILARFLTFSTGGSGSLVGTGSSIAGFLILAVLGGLFTLVMPCTYPMIPFTVNFFAKQAAAGRSLTPLALFYSLGIIGCFVGVGVLMTGVLKLNLSQLSGNPITNLVIAGVFLVLGASLLGYFVLQVPVRLQTALGGGRAGYAGALLMGLTFAITAFACTAPFAGSVLAAAAVGGTADAWIRAVIGMGVYSATIAIPFFVLAVSPGLLKRIPRAGAWMNEFKVIGGLVEIAAALKFLNISDAIWGWGIFGRDTVFALWAATCAAIAIYLLGLVRMPGDTRLEEVGPSRLLIALVFAAGAVWLASGLFGNDLGLIESFLAPE